MTERRQGGREASKEEKAMTYRRYAKALRYATHLPAKERKDRALETGDFFIIGARRQLCI